jgi:hypothetical protein
LATSKKQEQYYPGSSNKFTLTFQNAGTYKVSMPNTPLEVRFGYNKVNSVYNFFFFILYAKKEAWKL